MAKNNSEADTVETWIIVLTNHFRLNGAADRLDLPLFVYFPDSNVIF